MKIASFAGDDRRASFGVVVGSEIALVREADHSLPETLKELLGMGPSALTRLAATADRARRIPLAQATLLPPIPSPGKILAVGGNYASHRADFDRPSPKYPIIFNKQIGAVSGPFDDILLPEMSDALDYEGELAFVIGRACRKVRAADADQFIAGFTVLNDVSVRDWQLHAATAIMGKSYDTHCPFGPYLVTIDEVGGTRPDLALETRINGEIRQSARTSQLEFDAPAILEYISSAISLSPGDIIATGTPAGVGGIFNPPKYLKVGDKVEVSIEHIGTIVNHVVAELSTR